ncbi:uncharacterized protein alms1 isoform X1 [Misgurnus anguillicaudatus]|uniref:uncharacterized protein alms1 isoform X1 n=1 Tax=Misgurnus anguillicaudatus TaxID=75329 RepID=UPI003CCF7DFD
MDSEEDAANVNKISAEIPSLQHGQNMHNLEASRQCTDPDNVGIPSSDTHDSVAQLLINRSGTLQLLEFQDSQLSPALALLPSLDKSHPFSDSTFFHHTDAEFVQLRGFPDLSVISERCPRISHVSAADVSHLHETTHDQGNLSQHPLEAPAALSEAEISCCSLSQHSLSPGDHYKESEEQGDALCEAENNIDRHMEGEEESASQRPAGLSVVIGSSAVSSASETVRNQPDLASNQPNTTESQLGQTNVPAPGTPVEGELQSMPSSSREQPQGGSLSSSYQRTTSSDASNITIRDSRMRSHRTADRLRDQLLSEINKGSISGSRHHSENRSGLYVTPASAGGVHFPGLQRVAWSSGNLTAADGSFLSAHPVSQSTPAVPFVRPPPALTKLSLVHSQEELVSSVATSSQESHSKMGLIPSLDLSVVGEHSSTTCPQTKVPRGPSLDLETTQTVHTHTNSKEPIPVLGQPAFDSPSPDSQSFYSGTKMKDQVSHLALGRVQSLPSLSYLQKVDAWTTNQSPSRSFYDNLALKGFDGVPPQKNKSQDAISESVHHTVSQDMRQPPFTQAPTSSSLSGSGSPRRVDVIGAGVNHSHSSMSSVVTSIQRNADSHSPQVPVAQADDIISATKSLSNPSSLPLGRGEGRNNTSATLGDKSSVNPSPLISLGRFSDVSSSFNMSSTLSSSRGSGIAEQNMRASVGAASSIMSLEVDNYAPYWTSRPASPPQSRELNIEDRIPLYLLNLGIDQSPSTILNPFTRGGPIREPEFSPTDLCTIKGSIGTPTKSTRQSEVDSPHKEAFSSSSQVSTDSSASVTHHLSVHEQGQTTSVGTILSRSDTPPRLHSTLHPSSNLQHSDAPQSEGSFGLSNQFSPDSLAPPVPREEVKEDDSFVGSGTLHEIRLLLGRAESLVSGRSSLTSSPGSHRLSESDTSLVSLGRNSHNVSSPSAGGNFSLLLTRSSSDSALKGSSSSSREAHQQATQTDSVTTGPDALSLSRDESLKSRDLCVTPRRAEPEGCSAADPDKVKQPAPQSALQMNAPLMAGNVSQNQEKTENTVVASCESSLSHSSADSDSSSDSSLAARVAKLLQSESPVSVVTSRPSTADPEDSRAREWILMKVSGRQCESLELNPEDRKRIEDIKRELLLNTQHTKWSSDSEGSAQSSVGAGSGKGFVAVRSTDSHASDQLQRGIQKPLDSNVLHYTAKQQDLEAKVHQIALREGFSLPSVTSISIATSQHTPSPQFPSDHPITDTIQLGGRHETLQHNVHHKEMDTNLEIAYPQQRHQSVIIPNVSEEDKQIEGGGERKEENEDVTADDNKENVIKNDSHVDYIVTGSNQIMSSALSGTAPPNKSSRPEHQSHSVKYHSSRLSNQNNFKDVMPQRHSSLMSCSTDEQRFTYVNSISNQARSYEHKELVEGQYEGRVNPHLQARYPQTITPTERLTGTSRTLTVQAPAVPTLLPYKPHGSSELFYVQQADPDRSDTTIESSHPGSDDAVPPRFNIEILGSRELEDSAVVPKHKEGIYSKRSSVKRVSSSVSKSGLRESVVTSGRYNGPPPEASDVSKRDMDDEDNFVPLHMEADYSTDDLHLHNLHTMHLPSQPIRTSGLNKNRQDRRPHDVSIEINSSLDQLWRRFNEKWSVEDTRPTNDGDTSLLDRLERLSRLIHSTTPTDKTVKQPDSTSRGGEIRSDEDEGLRTEEEVARERIQFSRQAWAEKQENPESMRRCPAERDESMETSSSLSTIDTERLLRVFGHRRVTSKGLPSTERLLRLHNKQKIGRRKPSTKHAAVSVATETVSTDDSTASADYLSSSSTISITSQRDASTKKPKVKLLSKSVQAGDLEIVINGTRRHTRDVGTIFPSPGASSNARTLNPLSRSVQGIPVPTTSTAKPTHTLSGLKRDSSSKPIGTRYPNGVSWFVSADELKSDGRKENQPQSESEPCLSKAWFEPYSKSRPWREPAIREPLRERQIQVEQERPIESRTAIGSDSSDKSSALVRLSLQEALELYRPGFVSRSRERMKRLELLVEERRIQSVFNREREELFSCPAPSRPLRPAPVPRKRVVPRREMVQRSKHLAAKKAHSRRIDKTDRVRRKYAKLPEVQKRMEEERRRAEYSSYRLNAQLFNKKVTNRVLGRRAPWQ